jgi:hypothetical protein
VSNIPKVDPLKLYKPLMGYVSDAGAFNENARLRGSEKPVQDSPKSWIEADCSDAEFIKARDERFPEFIGLLRRPGQ